MLFGSRARGDERAESDWDLGYLASDEFDVDDLLARLVTVLGSDRIDLVNLGRAGAQLRYRAAVDAVPIFSAYGDSFRRLSDAAVIDRDLASRLVRAAGFRNIVAHAYENLDMARVYRAARDSPADLRSFLAALRDRLS